MAAYVIYGRTRRRASLLPIGLGAIALVGITACSKLGLGGGDEMSWARAALERNGRLEVVAADPQTSTFTVRVKDTGELRMVRADQVVAGPPGINPSSSGAQAAPPSDSSLTGSPGTGVAATAPADGAPGSAASAGQGGQANPGPGDTLASQAGPANAVPGSRTGLQPEAAPRAEVPNASSDVASITPGGRTLEAGPGYAIKTASRSAPEIAHAERERSSTTSAVERRHEPIVCQGNRLLHIDNRNLEFDGDAVSAQDGCEIHITNSHITARGVGVSARAANVHIDNSQIEGDTASIDASDGAQVYAASSMFRGLSRRLDNSSFHDLGGNVWN
jgi:hypothetical protein